MVSTQHRYYLSNREHAFVSWNQIQSASLNLKVYSCPTKINSWSPSLFDLLSNCNQFLARQLTYGWSRQEIYTKESLLIIIIGICRCGIQVIVLANVSSCINFPGFSCVMSIIKKLLYLDVMLLLVYKNIIIHSPWMPSLEIFTSVCSAAADWAMTGR